MRTWCLTGKRRSDNICHDCEGNGGVAVLFDSFMVPPHQGQPAMADRRVDSYWFRNRERRGRGLKFAFKPLHIEYVKQHVAYPKNRGFAKLIGFPRLYDKTLQSLYGSILRRLSSKRIFRFFFSNQFAAPVSGPR